MLINIPVRFFSYSYDDLTEGREDDNELTTVEVSHLTFESLKGVITYERHTIFANGVRQICLTVEPSDYPMASEVSYKNT